MCLRCVTSGIEYKETDMPKEKGKQYKAWPTLPTWEEFSGKVIKSEQASQPIEHNNELEDEWNKFIFGE